MDGCAATLGSCEEPERLGLGIPLRVVSLTPTGCTWQEGAGCAFRLSWVSVAVGLLAAALFLVPTASRSDVREVVLAHGTVEKQLVTKYISLGRHLIGYFFRAPAGWTR